MSELFTSAQLAEIAAYHRPLYAYAAVNDVVNLLFYALLLRFGVRPLYALAERLAQAIAKRVDGKPGAKSVATAFDRLWGGNGWGTAMLFAASYFTVTVLAFLPLDVFFDYLHEQRYGLSGYGAASFAVDYLKSVALGLVPTLALAFGLFGLARRIRSWWSRRAPAPRLASKRTSRA